MAVLAPEWSSARTYHVVLGNGYLDILHIRNRHGLIMPLYIKELGRTAAAVPLRARIAAWHLAHKLPPATGLVADKRFFDEVSGEA